MISPQDRTAELLRRVTHVWSDTHFGHANILAYADRPYAHIDAHDNDLIIKHNETVKGHPRPVTLHCGDFALCGFERARAIMHSLIGTHVLVRGNHDRFTATQLKRIGFAAVLQVADFTIGDLIVRASHYPPPGPPAECPPPTIHGHTHSSAQVPIPGRPVVHVGVDAWDLAPVPVEKIGLLLAQNLSDYGEK